MIGKLLHGSRKGLGKLVPTTSSKTYDLKETYQRNPEALPIAPANPYKKRPVKLAYDRNEYWTFRLPSEESFLLGSYDKHDLFGKRKGIEHSPLIKAQIDMDSNILWAWFVLTFVALVLETKYNDDFVALRQNMVNSDYGKFELEDFK